MSVPLIFSLDEYPSLLLLSLVFCSLDDCPFLLLLERLSLASDPRRNYPILPAPWTSVPPSYSLDECPSLYCSLDECPFPPPVPWTSVPLYYSLDERPSSYLLDKCTPLFTVPWTSVTPSYSLDEYTSLYCSPDECPSLIFTGRVYLSLLFPG
jgi:hypothetical protein